MDLNNKKGEDWGKYVKEIQDLAPMLSENMERRGSGIIGHSGKLEPINSEKNFADKNGAMYVKEETRQQKRKREREYKKRMGKVQNKEYLDRMLKLDKSRAWLKDANRVTDIKLAKINEFYNKELEMLLGEKRFKKIAKYIEKYNKRPWWHWSTYVVKLKITHDARPYPWGSDKCEIRVFGKLHVAANFIWEG